MLRTFIHRVFGSVALPAALFAGILAVPGQGVAQAAAGRTVAVPVVSEKDSTAAQEELLRLLRLSPTLTEVVAHDPSLLANQEYVNRTNPQLGQFLQSHPEIARNPDFYLFTRLNGQDGSRDQVLERAVWPELTPAPTRRSGWDSFTDNITPFLVFLCVAGALLWLIRLFVDNRRWSRIFKLQTEVHGRLIDKFGSNQELLVYMGTEAGRRFLEAAPIPLNFEQDSGASQRMPSAVARVLLPLQIGIVMTLLGIGFNSLRGAGPDMDVPMRVLGTLVLMPGIGFILSAGVSWLLAGRLGMMPERVTGLPKADEQ
jgi:hypothetical protein